MIKIKKITSLVFFVFSVFICIGQTYSTLIDDKEIYIFLNWLTITEKKYEEEPLLSRKQISSRIIKWNNINFVEPEKYSDNVLAIDKYFFVKSKGLDTIFKHVDRKIIFEQYQAIKDSIWHKSFDNSKLLTTDIQKRNNRYYYSIPLFSENKQYVIIIKEYYCGDLCAHGGVFVYKRNIKNKWEYYTTIYTWES